MKSEPAVAQMKESLEDLVRQARNGDRQAFDRLIRIFEGKVMKTALYLTRNLQDAQDVAQEVYMKIFLHLDKYDDTGKTEQWIYRMTVNAAYDLHRRRRFWIPLRDAFFASSRDTLEQKEIRNRLIEALGKLSFRERAAFVFKQLHEMETAQVADIMGCREVTVRGYLLTARKKLQAWFKDWENDL